LNFNVRRWIKRSS